MMDRIFSSSPVNAMAARVTSRGIHFEPAVKQGECHWHFDAPPPLTPITSRLRAAEGFEDLTGRMMGRMAVIGFYGARNKKRKSLWLLRCACGDYETRTAKGIKNCADVDHCCYNCNYVRGLKGPST